MNIIEIEELIKTHQTEQAIEALLELLKKEKSEKAYYLLGNAYRKQGNWQYALNNYYEAVELNPESPARFSIEGVMDILNYRNPDMINP